jgi:N-acyl-D-amino-acid deacylase
MMRAAVPLFFLLCHSIVSAAEFDLLIQGGRVIDGMGTPARFVDIGVTAGRIAALGRNLGPAKRTLNASNLLVAPGFIDVHTHAENVDVQPLAENFLRMGVTSIILGNCGSSETDLGAFFRRLEATNISINVASLIGQGSVRSQVMGGSFMRPASAAEMRRMEALVEKAMDDGAVGLSTGLIYLPGTFTPTTEIIDLARISGAHGGLYASHMRDESREIFPALDELFRIAREARLPAHISHLKLSGPVMWNRHDEVLAAIERARSEGLDITQDQYLYTASSTGISQLIPEESREGGRAKFRERLADPGKKSAIIEAMKAKVAAGQRTNYSYAVIASYDANPTLNGLNVKQAALKARGSDSIDDQIELVLEIESKGGASGVFHGMSEDDLRAFQQHPNTMFASDSEIRVWQSGAPHPRGYGNSARALARYVRELHLLRVEEAVRRMTSLPATVFRLKDRGLLREGAWADIVVFDPATVQDNATFAAPHSYATGFRAVLVNGVPVVENDAHTHARPGKIVRRGQ